MIDECFGAIEPMLSARATCKAVAGRVRRITATRHHRDRVLSRRGRRHRTS